MSTYTVTLTEARRKAALKFLSRATLSPREIAEFTDLFKLFETAKPIQIRQPEQ
jgi:uncharacterized protein VirK/YbjX